MAVTTLGEQIRARRNDLGVSQTALGDLAGVSRNYISLIERGRARNVSLDILGRLSIALRTTPAALLGEAEMSSTVVGPWLRELARKAHLPFQALETLSRIPSQGKEPETLEEWERIYEAVREYL
jgi:transcriptional regulator with XRE-family HTH domain